MPYRLILVFVILFFAACSDHSEWRKDYLERSISVGGAEYKYRVWLPKKSDPNAKVPVMLFLHGSGFRGDDNIAQVDGFRWAIDPVKGDIDFVAVLPQCRNRTFWSSVEMSNYALAALDAAVNEFNGDPERLYLAGFSLGGYGTWQIAAGHPGKFAALVPIAGGVVGERPIDPRDREAIIPEVGAMLDSPEPYQAFAKAIGQTAVWAFHGDADEAVPVEFARKMVKALADAGNKDVRYTEYAKDGHMIMNKAFAEPGLFKWLADQKLTEPK